jgi:hypothetical protein
MADPTTTPTMKRISKLSRLRKTQRRLFCEKNDDPFEDDLEVEKEMAEWSTPPTMTHVHCLTLYIGIPLVLHESLERKNGGETIIN